MCSSRASKCVWPFSASDFCAWQVRSAYSSSVESAMRRGDLIVGLMLYALEHLRGRSATASDDRPCGS